VKNLFLLFEGFWAITFKPEMLESQSKLKGPEF